MKIERAVSPAQEAFFDILEDFEGPLWVAPAVAMTWLEHHA